MGFLEYVDRLRVRNDPQPFSSKVCQAIRDILRNNHTDLHRSEMKKFKLPPQDQIPLLP